MTDPQPVQVTREFLEGVREFLKDVQPGCAAGDDQLLSLRLYISQALGQEYTDSTGQTLQVGQQVSHPGFGTGVIRKLFPTGYGPVARVRFPNPTGKEDLYLEFGRQHLTVVP